MSNAQHPAEVIGDYLDGAKIEDGQGIEVGDEVIRHLASAGYSIVPRRALPGPNGDTADEELLRHIRESDGALRELLRRLDARRERGLTIPIQEVRDALALGAEVSGRTWQAEHASIMAALVNGDPT
jgi:hypothetical protein